MNIDSILESSFFNKSDFKNKFMKTIKANKAYRATVVGMSSRDRKALDNQILSNFTSSLGKFKDYWLMNHCTQSVLLSFAAGSILASVGIAVLPATIISSYAADNTVKTLYAKSEEVHFGETPEYIKEAVANKYTKQYKDFNDFCKSIQTPDELKDWYWVNKVRWYTKKESIKKANKGINSTIPTDSTPITWPNELIKTHIGICYDHAIFMHMLCEKANIKSTILFIVSTFKSRNDKYSFVGHAVSVFDIKDRGVFIFNYQLGNGSMLGPFASFDDAKIHYTKIYSKAITTMMNNVDSDQKYINTYSSLQETNLDIYSKFNNDNECLQIDIIRRVPELNTFFTKINKDLDNFIPPTWIDEILRDLKPKILNKILDLFNNNPLKESTDMDDDDEFDDIFDESAEIILRNLTFSGRDSFQAWFHPSQKFFEDVGTQTINFFKKNNKDYSYLVIYDPKETDQYKQYQAWQLCNYIQGLNNTGDSYLDSTKDSLTTLSGVLHISFGKQWLSYLILFGDEVIEKIFLLAFDNVMENLAMIPIKVPAMETYRDKIHMEDMEDIMDDDDYDDTELIEFAGPGGMTPAPDLAFVTQYGPVHTDSNTISGYGVSNDILSKNIIIRDEKDGMVKKESMDDFLKDRKIKMFRFMSDPEGIRIIENALNTIQSRAFIYETLTNKKLLSDDQLLCDEMFEEVSPIDIGADRNSIIQTIIDQYKSIKGEDTTEIPLTNTHDIKEANELTYGYEDIVIMENQNGVFAKNTKTGRRTAYYNKIKDIPIKVVQKKNV